MKNSKTKIYLSLLILFFLNFITWQNVYSKHLLLQDSISFLDVGQGSATLIQTSNSYQILIDAGPDETILSQLAKIMPHTDKIIELAIITHPHADHLVGYNYILQHYKIKAFIITDIDYNEDNYQHLKQFLDDYQIPTIIANQHTDIHHNQISIDILYPFTSIQNQEFEEINNSSIAMKIITPNLSVLITGDLHSEIEQELVQQYGKYLQSDILVAGHHGSKTSTADEFLNIVNPRQVIISCGTNNKFGHPSPETIAKLTQKNIQIHRTDLDGKIDFDL